MRFLSTVALGLLALATTCTDAALVQHEKLTSIPRGWSLHSEAVSSDAMMTYRIAMKQSSEGVAQLESYLLEHSANPASDKFGAHLTKAEVDAMVAPSSHHIESVVEWLSSHGIQSHELVHTSNSDFISFKASVSVAEKLLNTQYKTYKHVDGATAVRTDSYHLPEHISSAIDYITSTTKFPQVQGKQMKIDGLVNGKLRPLQRYHTTNNNKGSFPPVHPIKGKTVRAPPADYTLNRTACSEITTPQCLRLWYGSDSYTPQEAKNGKNNIAVVEYIGQFAQENNLEASLTAFSVPYYGKQAARETFKVIGDAGNPQGNYNNNNCTANVLLHVTDVYSICTHR